MTTPAASQARRRVHAGELLALSPDDQFFLAQLALATPFEVEREREVRLTDEGLVERRHGRLVLTPAGWHLLGLDTTTH